MGKKRKKRGKTWEKTWKEQENPEKKQRLERFLGFRDCLFVVSSANLFRLEILRKR